MTLLTRLFRNRAEQERRDEVARATLEALEAGREEGYWQGVNAWQQHDLFDTGEQDHLIGTTRERRAFDEHPAFTAAVTTIQTLVLGDGVTYGVMQDDTAYGALEEWYALNDVGEYSKEILKAYLLDGELLLLLAQDAARTEPAWLNLWDTVEHAVTVNTADGNPRVITSIETSDRTLTPQEFVYRSNRRRMNDPRGRSVLRTAVTPAERYTRLVNEIRPRAHEIRARLNGVYYAMATNARELEAKAARYRRLPRDGNIVTLQMNPQTGHSEKLEMMSTRTDASDAEADARGLIRTIAMVAGVPEHFMAIGDTANLATAKAMSEPMIRRMEGHQTLVKSALTEAFRKELIRRYGESRRYKVVRIETRDGRRERITEFVTAHDLEIPFSLPPVRDEEATDLERIKYGHEKGLLSDQSATEELGFDPALEAERLSNDTEANPEQPEDEEAAVA